MAELVLPSGAIKIIQSQQQLVGGAIAGGAGSVGAGGINPELDILEQIKELTFKSFKKTTQIAKTLADSLAFGKNQTRRKNDQSAELSKESGGGGAVGGFIDSEQPEDKKGGLQGMGFALGAAVAPLMNFIGKIGKLFTGLFASKIFGPITKLFGKGGTFLRFLGPLGPIGLIAGGLFLLFKYSDEIVKALAPAIDKIKQMAKENAPLIEALKNGFDWLFKNIIGGLGRVIGGIIDDIGPLFSGFSKILQGDIMGGLTDLGKGLLNIVLMPISAVLRFFEPVLAKIEGSIRSIGGNILSFFKAIPENVSTAFTNLIIEMKTNFANNTAAIKSSIMGIFAPISDFFSALGDRVKTIINSLIEKLPLPDIIKKKLKLETKATQELGETVNETGVKNKYADSNISGMKRERMTGGGATMDEAFAESKGEKYGKASIKKSGTSGYDSASGIMTPAEFSEYNKLDTNGQMDYLKSLDANEQERRRLIDKLSKEKLEFDKNNKDYIDKYKTAPDEMMSPDDQMLQDSKFQRQAKNQAKGLVSDGKSGNQTIIVNNSPTTVTSQNDIKKADMYSGNINTSSGDSYFERNIEGYSA